MHSGAGSGLCKSGIIRMLDRTGSKHHSEAKDLNAPESVLESRSPMKGHRLRESADPQVRGQGLFERALT